MYKLQAIYFIKMSLKNIRNGVNELTKELALSLLGRKGVYLTSEGKRLLEVILKERIVYEGK
ncbi:hypothetical protein ShirakiTB12_54320 [Priestia megaterium]|uniref:Uncharacterized protein n=1 Tax=Priestia megaterium TaxID=1404 RepID=A0AAX6BT51_PRIMG|nr:hypothetical protein ShirakiTB12_54320 [Priestia megaterium]